jgi:toxin ParE1/3/4
MTGIQKHAAAKRDLVRHYVYLFDNAGLEVAERFLLQAEKSFISLSRHPKMGLELQPRSAELAGLRKWPVKGFENFLIFYRPRPKGISIVRVIHGSQDWWTLLGLL